MKVPKLKNSSAEVAAAADDVSIVNAIVTVLFTQASLLSLSEPEGPISG